MIGTGTALAIGATSLAGGLVSANQAKQQAKGVAAATDAANRQQLSQYEQTRADQEPWRKAGAAGASRLSQLMGLSGNPGDEGYGQMNQQFSYDANADPGTQFRISQANKALERSAAAKGNLMSGGTLKSLASYNQDMASQEYGNAYSRWKQNQDTTYNRLAGIAGLGQTATQATNQAGMNYANQYGQNAIGGAQAQASAGIAGNNAIMNGVNQGINSYNQYQMHNFLGKGQGPGGAISDYSNGQQLYGSGYGGTEVVR